jgi:hypothetical protein
MGTLRHNGKPLKVVPWARAAKYTKRAVFVRRESTGEFMPVAKIAKKGPNLWVETQDGRAFLVDRGRTFYAYTTKEGA